MKRIFAIFLALAGLTFAAPTTPLNNIVFTGPITSAFGATITDPGTGALALTASGTNQGITLTPSGTGNTYLSRTPPGNAWTNVAVANGAGWTGAFSYAANQLLIVDQTNAYNANPLSGIGFVGARNNGTYDSQFAAIYGGKENATAGNNQGFLDFFTTTASTTPTRAIRINSVGSILLGTTTDSSNGRLQLATHTTSAGGIGFGTDWTVHRETGPAFAIAHNTLAANATYLADIISDSTATAPGIGIRLLTQSATGGGRSWALVGNNTSAGDFQILHSTTAAGAPTTVIATFNNAGDFNIASTTDATTGGVGSLTTAGGIYAAKQIITNTNFGLTGVSAGSAYVLLPSDTGTYTGNLVMQAGGGSALYGGAVITYGAGHATKPGWVTIGLGSASAGRKLTVNNQGLGGGTDVFSVDYLGNVTTGGVLTVTPIARTSGVASYFTVNGPADTTLTASTESIGVNFAAGTRTWADGTVATQREYLIQAPTYNKTTTSATFTKAATLTVSNAPQAGAGVTITNPYALWVQAGLAQFDGGLTNTGVTTLTPAARAASAPYFLLTIPADTAQTASTESIGYRHATGTRTWATTGTVALQRENSFEGPTYASASASQTFTDAFTLYATPPIAGTNAIFTRGHTLGIVDATSAASSITGGLVVATTLGTTATSTGIGGGNINTGGALTVGGNTTHTGTLTQTGTSTFTGLATFNGTASTSPITVLPVARTSVWNPYVNITAAADTAMTASTAFPGVKLTTATRQWAAGTVTFQPEVQLNGVTLAGSGATATFTDAATLHVTPPIVGTNAAITRNHSVAVVDSTSSTTSITGGLIVATTLGTAATSVGIGNGNITAGGAIYASTSTGRLGYLAGSGIGTAVSQGTSRVTGVTSNTPTGVITMFSAAGSATAASFVVSCTSIAVGDTVIYAVSSGATNTYQFATSAISAGTSFTVSFWTTGGTATDAPVVNYTIIKGSSN